MNRPKWKEEIERLQGGKEIGEMSELKTCPFCGGGNITLEPKGYWAGMQTHVTHYELRHWCPKIGVKSSRPIIFEGLTQEETSAKWNRRSADKQATDRPNISPERPNTEGESKPLAP
jgi:hypothetical protein